MWWENLDLPKATPPNAGDSSNKVVSNDFPSVKEASESKKKIMGIFLKRAIITFTFRLQLNRIKKK